MAANLYYDIKVTVHFNEFDIDSLDPSVLAFNKKQFDAVNIGLFFQTKTMLDTKEPMAQLRLNQIPESLVEELNRNAYYLEVAIFQGKAEYYRNFYNVIEADSVSSDQTPRLGSNLVNSNLILKSMIMSNMEKDKSLIDTQVEIQSDIGYIKSKDLVYDKMPASLIGTYGTAFQVFNRINKNINGTGYKDLTFPSNASNLDSIAYMHKHYPVSLNHCLYGFDEGFDTRQSKNITELITVDLMDAESWLNQSSECIAFEKDPEVIARSEPTVFLEGSYFPSNFTSKVITSKKRVRNTIDGATFDLEPFSGKITKVPVFNNLGNNFSNISDSTTENNSLEFVETTLSEKDYILQQESLIELYSKNPQIYTVNYASGCPYDIGRLGRKSNLAPKDNNLTIAADIKFFPNPNDKDVQELKETSEKTDPFICTAKITTLSYDT